MLRRKNVDLDSYTCEMYLRQKEETLRHLSLRCPFTKKLLYANWCVGANMAQTRERNKTHQESIGSTICNGDYNSYVLVHMKERNGWPFNNEDPSVEHCKLIFKMEFTLVINRVEGEVNAWYEIMDAELKLMYLIFFLVFSLCT
jgi:hypothetical protein